MIHLFPTKTQWAKWSLPSRLTALAFYLSLLLVAFSLISYGSVKTKEYLSTLVGVKGVLVKRELIDTVTKGGYKEHDGTIEIRYPRITHILPNPFLDAVNKEIRLSALAWLDEYIVEYRFNYSVGLVTPHLLSLKMEQYYYYHLAMNGNESLLSVNIDPSNGKVIDFFDVFDSRRNALAEVKALLARRLEKDQGSYFQEELERSSFIPRFFIKNESIEFVFSEYEVTPGVCGSVSVDVSYGEVGNLLRHDGPLGILVSPTGSWEAFDHFMSTMERLESLETKEAAADTIE